MSVKYIFCLVSCLTARVALCFLMETEKMEILMEHNRLRGIVNPTASNMEQMVCETSSTEGLSTIILL